MQDRVLDAAPLGAENISNQSVPPSKRILFLIIAVAFFIRLLVAWRVELFPDETLYAWQGAVMPGSFCPHPPVTLWITKIGIALLGKNEIGVRFLSVVLSTLMLWPLWLLARDLGEKVQPEKGANNAENIAFWAVVTSLALPIYFAFGAITTPDGTQLFFWTCALLYTWRALNSARWRWWIATGFAVGAGLFVKYVLVLFLPALLGCLLLVPQWRAQLKTVKPWASFALAFALFLPPFLRHEYSNNWITVAYHLGSRQKRQAPEIVEILKYQAFHMAYYSPILYVMMICAVVWAWREIRKPHLKNEIDAATHNSEKLDMQRRGALAFVAVFASVPFLFFALIASVTHRELSREQWDAPSYVTASIALALWASWLTTSSTRSSLDRRKARNWTRGALLLGFAMSLFAVIESTSSAFSRVFDVKPIFANMIGAREVAQEIDEPTPSGFHPDFLIADNWTTALSYSFYAGKMPFYTVGEKFDNRYGLVAVLRRIEFIDDSVGARRGKNFLVLKLNHARREKVQRELQRELNELRPCFTNVRVGRNITVMNGRKVLRTYRTLECSEMKKVPPSWILQGEMRSETSSESTVQKKR